MKQAMHIFCKDVRHLWPRALLLLLLIAAHAVFEVRSPPAPPGWGVNSPLPLLVLLTTLGISFLISWLIFEEPFPGDRQFWITRPYNRASLLSAKVLFIILFINLPLFASDCYILGAQAFPVIGALPQLALRQLYLSSLFILPSFTIATLVNGLSQFAAAWMLTVAAFVASILVAPANTSINGDLFLPLGVAVAIAIIVWQYVTRRTRTARVFLAAVLFASWYLAFALGRLPLSPAQQPLPEFPQYHLRYEPDRPPTPAWNPTQGTVNLRIPLFVNGVPPGTVLRGNVHSELNPGKVSVSGAIEKIDGEYWQRIDVNSQVRSVKDPVSLRSDFDLEIVTDRVETRIPVSTRTLRVPGVGLCHGLPGGDQLYITCRAGLIGSVETTMESNDRGNSQILMSNPSVPAIPWGLSPVTDLGFSPLSNYSADATLVFTPRHQIAHFHRTLELHDFPIAKYMAR